MKHRISFLEMLQFFQRSPTGTPGSPEYNASFCNLLITAASADAASIWQLDTENQLQLISSTDIPHDRVMDITLRPLRRGEGISGAASLSRLLIFVVNAEGL